MSKMKEGRIRRVLDANFNRAKEGLRVCEDVCRFVYDDRRKAAVFKALRHEMTEVTGAAQRKAMVLCRDIQGDVGRQSIGPEMRRRDVEDILFANLQRVKESVRVLEEFAKLSSEKNAQRFKEIRYGLYHAERGLVRKFRKD